MYKAFDEVMAADLEVGDVFQHENDFYTVKDINDEGNTMQLVVTDKFDDDDYLALDAFIKVDLYMEVDDDDS